MNNISAGRRNLILLGVGAAAIALLTTSIELWVYHGTGDIYLDRSRPGYLPDKDETDQDQDTNSGYSFSDSGPLTATELEEYLKELNSTAKHLRGITDPYSPLPLSDDSLGITSKPTTPEAAEPDS